MNPAFWPFWWFLFLIIVSQRHAKRVREEEEAMLDPDLDAPVPTPDEGWEYKILRAGNMGFRKPERFNAALADEARAGWDLVEKLDDGRLRLRRPLSRRLLDAKLDFDPYRTQVNTVSNANFLVILGIAVAVALTGMLWLVARPRREVPATPVPVPYQERSSRPFVAPRP